MNGKVFLILTILLIGCGITFSVMSAFTSMSSPTTMMSPEDSLTSDPYSIYATSVILAALCFGFIFIFGLKGKGFLVLLLAGLLFGCNFVFNAGVQMGMVPEAAADYSLLYIVGVAVGIGLVVGVLLYLVRLFPPIGMGAILLGFIGVLIVFSLMGSTALVIFPNVVIEQIVAILLSMALGIGGLMLLGTLLKH